MFLLEKSIFLKKVQRKKNLNKDVKWIDNFNEIKKGPVVFFGNEFFDAIPIKQFKKIKSILFRFFKISFHKSLKIFSFKFLLNSESTRGLQ